MKKSLLLLVFNVLFFSETYAAPIDRGLFYETCKSSFPKHIFIGQKKDAFEKIFDYWEKKDYADNRKLAYILATAYRESAGTMLPVREGLCASNECAIRAVTKLVTERGIKPNYALPDESGRSYYGRGYVQLTGKRNYRKMSSAMGLGDELVVNPDLALDLDRSTTILIEGMERGLFTGHKLSDFFNDEKEDWINARNIVNPGSARKKITAEHGKNFNKCLLPVLGPNHTLHRDRAVVRRHSPA